MTQFKSRGELWFSLLTNGAQRVPTSSNSVICADYEGVRFLAVIPDEENPYPRARHGEVGLLEGWSLADIIERTIQEDVDKSQKRPIVAVVDVPSQAYGRREEAFGIHQSLASAVAAYAKARNAGHPVVALIVGKAMSGAFLAHGYQAGTLLAFDDPGVLIHAMGKKSAARITLRTVEELDAFASTVPPMAYDIKHYATLGLLHELLEVHQPDAPSPEMVQKVRDAVAKGIEHARATQSELLSDRFSSPNRQASVCVRQRMREVWN